MSSLLTINNQFYSLIDNVYHIIPAQAFLEYWKDPDGCSYLGNFDLNSPKSYMDCPQRSLDLVELVKKHCSKDDKIFELGCNVGRNLHFLYKEGFKNLTGLDINEKALELGRKHYHDTVGKINLICSSLEDYIWKPRDKQYDVVFTMGFLMHVHPSSAWVVSVLNDLVGKTLITAEDEVNISNKAIPRNYKTVFELCGFKQLEEKYVEYDNDIDDAGKIQIMYRVFKKETDEA